jgi:hypothetical protein
MTVSEITPLAKAVENALTALDVDVDSACHAVVDFARRREIRLFFSNPNVLTFWSVDHVERTTKIGKGIFRSFCARLVAMASEGAELAPVYGGPLSFSGVRGAFVNTPKEQSVTLGPSVPP